MLLSYVSVPISETANKDASWYSTFSTSYNEGPLPSIRPDEDGKGWTIELEVPGYSKEEISVEIESDSVIVNAYNEKRGEKTRTITFPQEADLDGLTARLSQGILTVFVPIKETAKPRKVTVG